MSREKEKKVKIRVLPLRGIGGIGSSGAEGFVTKAEAEKYVAEGYATIISEEEPEVVPSSAVPPEETVKEELPEGEIDHEIMKPEKRR